MKDLTKCKHGIEKRRFLDRSVIPNKTYYYNSCPSCHMETNDIMLEAKEKRIEDRYEQERQEEHDEFIKSCGDW